MNRFLCVLILSVSCCFANSPTLIITGASGELGMASAKLLAKDNNLILTGRNKDKLEKLQAELQADHPWNYTICTLDYLSNSSMTQFKNFLETYGKPISGIALISSRPAFYGKNLLQEEEKWLQVFQANFTGPLEALKAVLPHLTTNSKIAIIAGTTSVQLLPDTGPSCVIRRMWTTYSKALSHELGPKGIRVNCLSPGVVLTNFHQDRIEKKSEQTCLSFEEQMNQETASIPMRRHAKPEEVAQSIRFLLSDESDFVSGVNLVLDGGYTVSY